MNHQPDRFFEWQYIGQDHKDLQGLLCRILEPMDDNRILIEFLYGEKLACKKTDVLTIYKGGRKC